MERLLELLNEVREDVDFENGDMIVLPGGLPGTTYLGECEELTKQIVKFVVHKFNAIHFS